MKKAIVMMHVKEFFSGKYSIPPVTFVFVCFKIWLAANSADLKAMMSSEARPLFFLLRPVGTGGGPGTHGNGPVRT